MFYSIFSLIAGIMIILSRVLNANTAEKTNLSNSVFINNLSGSVFALILLIFFGNQFVFEFENTEWWMYLGGVVGILILLLQTYLVPRISAVYLTLLTFTGQLVMGIVFDYINGFELNLIQISGVILVFIGLITVLYSEELMKLMKEDFFFQKR
jgi:transporter family-2 protein